MNKRGFSLIADLKWSLTFIVIAVLLLFFAFKPLHDSISNRITVTDLQNNDAQYIALSLPRMADGDQQFSDTIRDVMDTPTADNIKNYKDFLDGIFNTDYVWTAYPGENAPERYLIVLRQGNAYLTQTCAEYTYQGLSKALCKDTQTNMNNDATNPRAGTNRIQIGYSRGSSLDKDTGMVLPNNANTEIGTTYIPTDEGPVMLQVMIQRGQRP